MTVQCVSASATSLKLAPPVVTGTHIALFAVPSTMRSIYPQPPLNTQPHLPPQAFTTLLTTAHALPSCDASRARAADAPRALLSPRRLRAHAPSGGSDFTCERATTRRHATPRTHPPPSPQTAFRARRRCVEGRYERTIFFDNIINRGLQLSTRFAYPHLTTAESETLQICQSGSKYYLAYFVEIDGECPGDDLGGAAGGFGGGAHSDMQRQLWRTISSHIVPEIQGASAQRSITVTKAVKRLGGGARTITQIVIEIDNGGGGSEQQQQLSEEDAAAALPPLPSFAAATAMTFAAPQGLAMTALDAAPCEVPLSPDHTYGISFNPLAPLAAAATTKNEAWDMDAASVASAFGVTSASSGSSSGGNGSSASFGRCRDAPSLDDMPCSKRARLGLSAAAAEAHAELCHALGFSDTKLLDDVDVDILSSLF
ncbi:hypothetical protein JKP88DRAFT_250896 [Tribonema minus]|uniref:Uncharacterized protein n=1 Tax=Tribonema minus TaxID=303371 RepID=A0A835ZER7_9STRA|nr:hypothetical protein JKP88DRAFT_250896 [Tribonema minus]